MRCSSQSRKIRQSGSVIVETALTFVPLMAFVFACFDVSLAIAMQNTLTFAAKQGVRYAITSQTQSGMNHDASIKSVVVANTMGMMPYLFPTTTGHSTDPNSYISITYYNPSTLALVAGTGSNRGGNICKVTISGLNYSWMGPLLRAPVALNMSAASSDVMEASPNGTPPTR